MAEQTQSLAELQAEYEAKIAKALAIAKTKLKTELDLVALTFESLVKAGQAAIWNDSTVAPILTSLGLQALSAAPASPKRRGRKPGAVAKPAKAKGTRKGKRGKQGETIIAALGSGHLATGEIAKKINYTGANLSAVLAGMKKADKIDKDKSNKWFVVRK
jgi:hypothetical protein